MEFPHEAALRECWEETGYQMHLLAMPAWPWLRPGEPPPPLAIDVGPANGCHLIQLVYCGICGNRSGQGEENIPIRWVSLAELAKISLPDNVRERYWQFRNLPTAGHCDWTTIPDFGE